jgi:hypothetical protein
MRVSNHAIRAIFAPIVVLSLLLAACGSTVAPSSAPPTAPPTPVITPDPHLTEPATADQVFNAIRSGGLPLSVNNATAGGPESAMIKKINADIGNWPLLVTEFRSAEALRKATGWDATKPPRQGNTPYAWVGLNILIEFGPGTGKLVPPNDVRQQQAATLAALIDPLLWPLEQRSVVPIPTRTAIPPSAPPSPSAKPKPSK